MVEKQSNAFSFVLNIRVHSNLPTGLTSGERYRSNRSKIRSYLRWGVGGTRSKKARASTLMARNDWSMRRRCTGKSPISKGHMKESAFHARKYIRGGIRNWNCNLYNYRATKVVDDTTRSQFQRHILRNFRKIYYYTKYSTGIILSQYVDYRLCNKFEGFMNKKIYKRHCSSNNFQHYVRVNIKFLL